MRKASFGLRRVLRWVVAALVPMTVSAAEPAMLLDTASGRSVTVETAAKTLSAYDVVIFGEFHDSAPVHVAEQDLFRELAKENGEREVLSMEMFERDTQSVLDAYLSGTVSEEDFLARSRPWPNYETDYRPLVELAKTEGLPVIAANVPRPLAAILAKSGSLDAIPSDQRQWLPEKTYAPEGPYRERFYEAMKTVAAAGMPVHPEKIEDMYRAQCLKDDAMAESIAHFLDQHPGRSVFHIQGEFHSTGRLGVFAKLHALRPALKIALITAFDGSPSEADRNAADYLLLVTR